MSKGRRMSNEGQTENKKSKPIFIILALVYFVCLLLEWTCCLENI